jgi:hypothetical protein
MNKQAYINKINGRLKYLKKPLEVLGFFTMQGDILMKVHPFTLSLPPR